MPFPRPSRRDALALAGGLALGLGGPARAQQTPPRFGFEDVVARAREIAKFPYDAAVPPLPPELADLPFDNYRDIRFRPDRSLLASTGGPFRMQMFHLGFLYRRPVAINVIRDGIATPVAYNPQLFDYGRNKFDKPLPLDLGFAGFRLHYPLNAPKTHDELIAFLGASYFRFLGRDQKYGLSARGLAINSGGPGTEEFPNFREFWIDSVGPEANATTIYALLDSDSLSGAFAFTVYPAQETTLAVQATLFPRKPIAKLGIAPLTSMFFYAENDRRAYGDFRPELHDSDGLMVHLESGEWVWRPLRNPVQPEISHYGDRNVRGFGLMQRDRTFEHYQDIDLNYEQRPSYWVEPREGFGDGRVELLELPTADETNDNIVAYWVPNRPVEPGRELTFSYTIKSMLDTSRLHRGGVAQNTFQTHPAAAGSGEVVPPGARRFIIDFSGGDLPYYLNDPATVELVPSTSQGSIAKTFLVPNREIGGFRAAMDVRVEPGTQASLRAFLKSGNRSLTETWTYHWKPA